MNSVCCILKLGAITKFLDSIMQKFKIKAVFDSFAFVGKS